MGEHVAVERIQRRVVDVRGEDALLEIVEDDDAYGAAQPAERPLVQLGPDLGAGAVNQQPDGLARIAQGEDEESCPPVLAGVRVTNHRSLPVINLRLLGRIRGDDRPSFDGGLLPDGRDEAPHARIARREAVVVDQVLQDGRGVAPAAERVDDQLAVGLARARLVALDGAVARGRVRRRRRPCRPPSPAKSRWTPPAEWPVLPDEPEDGHGPAPSGRPPSGSRWRSRAGPRWPLRSAAATSRGVPARGLVVVSLRSRRCSCRAGTSRSRPASTSRAAIGNGRFSAVH